MRNNNKVKNDKARKIKYIIVGIILVLIISVISLVKINNLKKDSFYNFERQAKKYGIEKDNINDLKVALSSMYNQYMVYEYNEEKYLVINIAKVNSNDAICNVTIDNMTNNNGNLDITYTAKLEQISTSSHSLLPKTIYGYTIVKIDNSHSSIKVKDSENFLALREFIGGAYKNELVTAKGEVITYKKDEIVYKVDVDKYMIPNKTENKTLLVDNYGNELNIQNGIVTDFEYIMSYGYSKYSTINLNGKYGVVDNTLNIVITPNYDSIKISDKGIMTISDTKIDLTQEENIVKEELNKFNNK